MSVELRQNRSVGVLKLEAALGADVTGVDLKNLADEQVEQIKQALSEHLVLRFRNTAVNDQEFTEFASRFGKIEPPPSYLRSRAVYIPEAPLVSVISNIIEDDGPKGEGGDGELQWHTDMAFTECPTAFTMLLAREVPRSGGGTSFANMYLAIDAMPERLTERLMALKIKHQASHNAQGGLRPGYRHLNVTDPREMPGATHPILRVHPVTGKLALYLGRRFGAYIPGLTLVESEALLDEVWEYAAQPKNIWTQSWQIDDLVIWDNRCTMHRRDAFVGHGRRRMHRLTVLGERPIGAISDRVEY